MGNINQPITRHLINSVVNKDWGLYLNAANERRLIYKKRGTIIPKAGTTLTTSDYDPGKYATKFIEITKRPVAEGYPFEFGLTFVRSYKNPGVHNNEAFKHQQYYGGKVLATRAMVDGVIADLDVLSIENQIIALAKLHAADNVQDKAFVNLRRAYVVTDSDPTDASGFTVTLEDGSAVVFASGAVFAAGKLGVDFNLLATVNTKLIAIRIGTNKYIITSIDPFYNFTIGTGVDLVIGKRYIYAENRTLDYKVDVQYNAGECTVTGAYLQVLNCATMTTSAFALWVNGVTGAVTQSANIAALLPKLTVLHAEVFATEIPTAQVWIYAPGTFNSFDTVLPDTSTLTKIKECSPNGGFAFLTSNDIFRIFMNRPADGILANQTYRTQAIDGGIYRKFTLTTLYTQDATEGPAGGIATVQMVVELYMLKSEAIALKFKADGNGRYMDETLPAGADTSFTALLATLIA